MLAARVGIGLVVLAAGASVGFFAVHAAVDDFPPDIDHPPDLASPPPVVSISPIAPAAPHLVTTDLPPDECVADVYWTGLAFARTTAKRSGDYAIDSTGISHIEKIPPRVIKVGPHATVHPVALDTYAAKPPALPVVDARGRLQSKRDLDDTEAVPCAGPLRAVRAWDTKPVLVEFEYAPTDACAGKVARICQLASVP